jgi:hypothetical protein
MEVVAPKYIWCGVAYQLAGRTIYVLAAENVRGGMASRLPGHPGKIMASENIGGLVTQNVAVLAHYF